MNLKSRYILENIFIYMGEEICNANSIPLEKSNTIYQYNTLIEESIIAATLAKFINPITNIDKIQFVIFYYINLDFGNLKSKIELYEKKLSKTNHSTQDFFVDYFSNSYNNILKQFNPKFLILDVNIDYEKYISNNPNRFSVYIRKFFIPNNSNDKLHILYLYLFIISRYDDPFKSLPMNYCYKYIIPSVSDDLFYIIAKTFIKLPSSTYSNIDKDFIKNLKINFNIPPEYIILNRDNLLFSLLNSIMKKNKFSYRYIKDLCNVNKETSCSLIIYKLLSFTFKILSIKDIEFKDFKSDKDFLTHYDNLLNKSEYFSFLNIKFDVESLIDKIYMYVLFCFDNTNPHLVLNTYLKLYCNYANVMGNSENLYYKNFIKKFANHSLELAMCENNRYFLNNWEFNISNVENDYLELINSQEFFGYYLSQKFSPQNTRDKISLLAMYKEIVNLKDKLKFIEDTEKIALTLQNQCLSNKEFSLSNSNPKYKNLLFKEVYFYRFKTYVLGPKNLEAIDNNIKTIDEYYEYILKAKPDYYLLQFINETFYPENSLDKLYIMNLYIKSTLLKYSNNIICYINSINNIMYTNYISSL